MWAMRGGAHGCHSFEEAPVEKVPDAIMRENDVVSL